MKTGYIKLHRSLLESKCFASEKRLKAWIWILLKATFEKRFVSLVVGRGKIVVELNPGELIFGRFTAEEELCIDGSTIYKILKEFEFEQMILIKSNSHYSIISVCNWETYQYQNGDEVTTNEQPSNSQVATNEQPSNTNKNDKKVKNEKNIIPTLIEIQNYCIERKNNLDAQYFLDYQTARDWKLKGGTKIKDWKAVIRTWEKNDFKTKQTDNNGLLIKRYENGKPIYATIQ